MPLFLKNAGVHGIRSSYPPCSPGFTVQNQRFASLAGAFGSEFFHGPKELDRRYRLTDLREKFPRSLVRPKINYVKYPWEVTRIRRELRSKHKEGWKQYRIFHIDAPNEQRYCCVGGFESLERRSASDAYETAQSGKDPYILKRLQEVTRGHVIQLNVTGKACRAFFDPDWPHLFYTGKHQTIDLTNPCIRASPDCRAFVNKAGTIITLHGYNRSKLWGFARVIHRYCKYSVVTRSGIQYSELPILPETKKKSTGLQTRKK